MFNIWMSYTYIYIMLHNIRVWSIRKWNIIHLYLVVIGPLTNKWHSMIVDVSPLSIQFDSLFDLWLQNVVRMQSVEDSAGVLRLKQHKRLSCYECCQHISTDSTNFWIILLVDVVCLIQLDEKFRLFLLASLRTWSLFISFLPWGGGNGFPSGDLGLDMEPETVAFRCSRCVVIWTNAVGASSEDHPEKASSKNMKQALHCCKIDY